MYCDSCDKSFNTWNGYYQHMEHSAAHIDASDFVDCSHCGREFSSDYALDQHMANSPDHPYCVPCKRLFKSENNLRQHLHSRAHVGSNAVTCPWCKESFGTASGLTIHLESGRCTASGLNRSKVNNLVRTFDRHNAITKPMIELPGYSVESIATERAWNGRMYKCMMCPKDFNSLAGLNQHLNSPAHEQKIYRCPGKGCGREYKTLGGLVQHIESESCGVMRFSNVQSSAQAGIQNIVGRMIRS